MHTLEHFGNWMNLYDSSRDPRSPFFGQSANYDLFSHAVYNYYIAPGWDSFGSETLYLKVLFADYLNGFVIMELIGEWNDALYNDIMQLKQHVVDPLLESGITQFILIGENVFNFHGSDDCYYEEWLEAISPGGWAVFANAREFVAEEMKVYGLDGYLYFGEAFQLDAWRTLTPLQVYKEIESRIRKELS